MSTTACSFASHFGQEMAQNADLPVFCKNFSGVTPPAEPPPCARTQGSVSRLPLFGSHNFQIVPARLQTAVVDKCDLNFQFKYAVPHNEHCHKPVR